MKRFLSAMILLLSTYFLCLAQKSIDYSNNPIMKNVALLKHQCDSLKKKGEFYKAYLSNRAAYFFTEFAIQDIYKQQEKNVQLQLDLEERLRHQQRIASINDRLKLRAQRADEMKYTSEVAKQNAMRKMSLVMSKQKMLYARQKAKIEEAKRIAATNLLNKEIQINSLFNRIVLLVLVFLFIAIVFLLIYMHYHALYMRKLREKQKVAEEAEENAVRARDETDKARKEAEKATVMKTVFIQNMSHEIRTPLNAIVGFSSILTDTSIHLDEAKREEFASMISQNSDLLITLINDILDLSDLASGNYKMKYAEITIHDICHVAYNIVKHRTPEGVVMSFDIPDPMEDISLWTDAGRVEQVLINYLTNACKYTSKGEIRLTYSVVHDTNTLAPSFVRFSVTDTGTGIPAEKAETIFKRFEKLDDFKQGNGLGLNICRTIADRLGAKCWLDTSYRNGCRFFFEIPVNHESK